MKQSRRGCAVNLFTGLLPGLLGSLGGALCSGALCSGTAPAQNSPAWQVQTIDGRTLSGALTMNPDGTLAVAPAEGPATTLQLGEAMLLRQPGVAERPAAPGPRVWLRSGSDLPAKSVGALAGGDGSQLAIELTFAKGVNLGFRQIAAILFERPGVALPTFDADRAAPASTQDYLYVVREGKAQRFSVAVTGFTSDQVDFELRGQTFHAPLADVAAVVFGVATGFAPDRQPGARATLLLDTGDRVSGSLRVLGPSATLRLDEGAELAVPIDRVRAIEVLSDRLVWLGSLKPKVEQVAAFDRIWPWTADRSPAGGPIRMHGVAHSHGLVMVPRTRLTFELGGAYDVFAATIGIEERGGPQANAIFRVYADGKLLHESQAITLDSTPIDLEIPLAKAKQLVLEADFGKNFDLGDLCVFADARVMKR